MSEPARPATARRLPGRRRGIRRPARRRSDARAAAAHRRAGALRRRGRPRHGRRRGRQPLFDRRSCHDRIHGGPAARCRASCGASAGRRAPWWRRGRTCSSSSTARASPWESRGGCAPPIPRSRSSNMSRRRCGLGGRAARAGHSRAISTTSSRCCRSSPRSISGSAARLAPMSAIRWRDAWQSCGRAPAEAQRRLATPPVLLVLPGSRRGEIQRLLGIFAETVALVTRANRGGRGRHSGRGAPRRHHQGRRRRIGRCARGSSSRRPTRMRRSASRGRRWQSPAR